MRPLLTILVLVALAATLSADSIILRSGQNLRGTIVAEHPDRVEIKLASGEVRTVPREDIVVLKKGRTPLDEYRKRLAAVKSDDVAGYLELADWCEEKHMRRQRIVVLRKALKADRDCPEARRALGEVWTGARWTEDEREGAVEPPVAGAKIRCEQLGFAVTLPKGFTGRVAADGGLKATGPERYRVPVVLEILESTVDPAKRFSAKGWSKPVVVKVGELEGLRSERETREDGHRMRTRELAYRHEGRGILVRLHALAAEFPDWLPHLAFLTTSLEAVTARPEHVVARLGIGFDSPPGGGWELIDGLSDQDGRFEGNVALAHRSSLPEDTALITYLQLRSDRFDGVDIRSVLEGLIQQMGNHGELKERKSTALGGLPAKLYDYSVLLEGTPMRIRFVVASDGSKGHLLMLLCQERAMDRFTPALEHVRKTFRTDVK